MRKESDERNPIREEWWVDGNSRGWLTDGTRWGREEKLRNVTGEWGVFKQMSEDMWVDQKEGERNREQIGKLYVQTIVLYTTQVECQELCAFSRTLPAEQSQDKLVAAGLTVEVGVGMGV